MRFELKQLQMRNLIFHLCLQKRNCATKTFTILEWLIELWTLPDEKSLNRKLREIFIHCYNLTELLFNANEDISHCKSMTDGGSIHFIDCVHTTMSIINQPLTLLNHLFDELVKLLLRYNSSALITGFTRQQALEVVSIPWSFIHQCTCWLKSRDKLPASTPSTQSVKVSEAYTTLQDYHKTLKSSAKHGKLHPFQLLFQSTLKTGFHQSLLRLRKYICHHRLRITLLLSPSVIKVSFLQHRWQHVQQIPSTVQPSNASQKSGTQL